MNNENEIEIVSTFPNRIMNEREIREYLKNNKELIILSSYTKCSRADISDLDLTRIWTKNGRNEYGGQYNEYWKIKKAPRRDFKYFNMLNKINEEKIDMTKLYLLSCISMGDEELNWEVMEYTYDLWLEADVDLDLSRLTDIVVEHWYEIQNDEIFDEDILEIYFGC